MSAFPWNDDCAVPAGDPSPGRVPVDTRPSSPRGTARLHVHQPLEQAPGEPGPGPPASASGVQTSVQASPQLPSWEGVAFVLQPRWPAGRDCPGVGVGALQLWAWQLAGGLPLCSPGSLPPLPDLVVTLGVVFFFAFLATGLVLSSPPAPGQWRPLSSSFLLPSPCPGRLHTPFPEPARVQRRCEHHSPALPFAPSACLLRPLASGWGSRCPGPCPLPLAPLRLRRRF